MQVFKRPPQSEDSSHSRILKAAQLFAAQAGYITHHDLAQAAGVAEGTLFRHFNKRRF